MFIKVYSLSNIWKKRDIHFIVNFVIGIFFQGSKMDLNNVLDAIMIGKKKGKDLMKD